MAVEFCNDDNYCTGCKTCVQACKDFYNLPLGRNFRTVTTTEEFSEDGLLHVSFLSRCKNPCKNHVCVPACPLSLITILKE